MNDAGGTRTERFAFGSNWRRFLERIDESRIAAAADSLRDMLGVVDLKGRSFLDVGSGSGMFSLAARRLGARVHSFDYDPESVACARWLRDRYSGGDNQWTITCGSILDDEYTASLGRFDVVYSWGVLHHTGAMWEALGKAGALVCPGGLLYVAIYNDQGATSRRWLRVKRLYNTLPPAPRWVLVVTAFARLWGPTLARDLATGRPGKSWRAYSAAGRGMTPWRDVVDWVGGYPFEVARPEQIFHFFRDRAFVLQRLKTCGGGLGCNEFVFTLSQ